MFHGKRQPRFFTIACGVLILVFLLECFLSSRVKSPSWDETGDIAAGLSYVLTGQFTVNPQHPPLLKELIGLSTLASGARWPSTPQAQQLLNGVSQYQWTVGSDIIAANGPDNVMFWARLPMILVAAMMGIVLYVWGRRMVGAMAGLGALFLCVLDPNVVAHAYLTTLDVGFASFAVLFFFALWSYARYPSWQRLALCGLALGAVLATKFSSIVLLPVAGLLILAAALRPPTRVPKAPRWFLNLYPFIVDPNVKTGPNERCPCGSRRKFKYCHGAGAASGRSQRSPLTRSVLVFLAIGVVAFLVIQVLYFFPNDPLLYVKGLGLVNADHNPDYDAYLAGTVDKKFYSYFAVAWLVKEPLATIALVVVGLVAVIRSGRYSLLDKLFLLVPPAVLFAAHSLLADALGIRYIIPAMVFTYLIGGVGIATLLGSTARWKRVAAGVLCAWLLVAAVGIYPDHLSYFNEAACLMKDPAKIGLDGGSKCGPRWLDDSNVDWGEGLKQLRAWWNQHAQGRPLRLAYFGSFPPEAYGIVYEKIDVPQLMAAPTPGLYAVSAHLVARIPPLSEKYRDGAGAWLRRTLPVAIVGHCMYIYDIK
ncbi:MAG TPA: glycosyltransferase family 39 protein [Bryobacteraceae bacterium]|jgi:hypothetical protein|nr:glycosyltransferase family 39 protein [Bryobacteraceae bacterium]